MHASNLRRACAKWIFQNLTNADLARTHVRCVLSHARCVLSHARTKQKPHPLHQYLHVLYLELCGWRASWKLHEPSQDPQQISLAGTITSNSLSLSMCKGIKGSLGIIWHPKVPLNTPMIQSIRILLAIFDLFLEHKLEFLEHLDHFDRSKRHELYSSLYPNKEVVLEISKAPPFIRSHPFCLLNSRHVHCLVETNTHAPILIN